MRIALAVLALMASLSASGQEVSDPRFCGAPLRNESGEIVRSYRVLREFERAHPCPIAGQPGVKEGTCPGWIRDHVIPLSCGGCDAVENLQWLPTDQWLMKSRWERKIYGGNGISKGCP